MKLTAYSKTFLLGEYGVLKDSPSLILTTDPAFTLNVEEGNSIDGLQGPILNFIGNQRAEQSDKFKKIKFIDPWEETGGFGASSAQFGLMYKYLKSSDVTKITAPDILREYRKYFWNCEGLAPSGHDVLAQMMGHKGVCWIDPVQGTFEPVQSQLDGYDFVVAKTNTKIATHVHLNQLQVVNLELREIVTQAKEGLENNNLLQLVSAVEEQNRILAENNLICEETLKRRAELEATPGVVITKGCGALGADTILIVCEKEQTAAVTSQCQSFVVWGG